MTRRGPQALLALLAASLLAGLLAGCAQPAANDNPAAVRIITTPDPSGLRGAVLTEPYDTPALTLTDTRGHRFDLRTSTRHPLTLVFFGYTHCPDECPTTLAAVAAALRGMDAAQRHRVQLVFVTTDPRRDTVPVLRRYLERFDPGFIGLTGSIRRIRTAARQLGIAVTGAERLPGGGYDVGHTAAVVGLGTDGRAHVVWTAGTPVADLRHDFTQLVGRS
jgi:protein SCO1/2